MGSSYCAESALRAMVLDLIRMAAPSCRALEMHRLPGPFRPGNWRIGKLDVLVQDYGAARDRADELATKGDWIMVPDGHPLDGQIYGQKQAR